MDIIRTDIFIKQKIVDNQFIQRLINKDVFITKIYFSDHNIIRVDRLQVLL